MDPQIIVVMMMGGKTIQPCEIRSDWNILYFWSFLVVAICENLSSQYINLNICAFKLGVLLWTGRRGGIVCENTWKQLSFCFYVHRLQSGEKSCLRTCFYNSYNKHSGKSKLLTSSEISKQFLRIWTLVLQVLLFALAIKPLCRWLYIKESWTWCVQTFGTISEIVQYACGDILIRNWAQNLELGKKSRIT